MARGTKTRRASKPKPRPRPPRLPLRARVQFGGADTGLILDEAFRAADDGDCSRTSKALDRAEAAGANVGLHRKQLMQDCTLDRTGLASPLGGPLGEQKDWLNWRTALIGVGALWLGSKIF